MKKSIFILAALFATALANAQISLDFVFNGMLTTKNSPFTDDFNGEDTPFKFDDAPYIIGINRNRDTISLFNKEDFSLYKNIVFEGRIQRAYCFAKGVYTSDQKLGCIIEIYRNNQSELWIVDEDGHYIYDLQAAIGGENRSIVYAEITHNKLFITKKERNTYVFSLPGDGDPNMDITTPSSPKRSARKIARDGQVFVETDNNTYTLQGQEVK